ncbi:unnamed protein product [Fusarium graminearum]|uniref:Uncharacterized protein n=1 Tax=Gibberella zeae TaxID=5518 RepID=A0A9N8WXH7_GIBZA|nr:unnamed protein product [Fusarium graminearum]CAG2000222.1 unnamed protein product [Fusarium graminearum]
MLELGENATRIIDMYSQEALADMAAQPKAEFYIARHYCLTFFYQRKVLFGRDNNFRQMFFDKPSSDMHP